MTKDPIEKYGRQLRQLVDEHYQQQLPLDVYREQRKLIFEKIELEFLSRDASDLQRPSERPELGAETTDNEDSQDSGISISLSPDTSSISDK